MATSTPVDCRCGAPSPGGRSTARAHRGTGWFAAGEPAAAFVVAAVVAIAAWRGGTPVTIGAALLGAVTVGRARFAIALVLVCGLAVWRADADHRSLTPDRLGPYTGWADVALDPVAGPGGTRVVLEVQGERFECWVRGRAARLRVGGWQQGDLVWISGERRSLAAPRAGRVAWQHVVGELRADHLGDVRPGDRLGISANRLRDLVARGTSVIPAPLDALARGLVIGDDRDQPPEMVARFRRSGLSHLTAVSGQNVALMLAAAGPLLRRMPSSARLVTSLGLIGWFVVLTRAEPSVLRAGAMASLAAIAFATGREREPPRLLAVCVVVLLIVDPLLVRSVGFWLSVGATAGVTVAGPVLTRALRPLGAAAAPVAVTLGAQLGVALPSLLVFGRLSVVGTLANLVAVPVAGGVMLYGLPASLISGVVPPVGGIVMLPVQAGVRWLDGVAAAAAALDPPPTGNAAGWAAVVLAVVAVGARSRGRRQARGIPSPAGHRGARLRQ